MIYTDSNQKHDLRDYQKTKDNNIKMNKKQLKQFNRKFRCFPGGVYLRKTDKPCQENDIKQFISTLLKAERKEIIEIGDKMKKNTHKKIEKEFWYDPEDNQKGEFEKYGEYEEFFVFTKKMTNQAIKNYQTKIKSLK